MVVWGASPQNTHWATKRRARSCAGVVHTWCVISLPLTTPRLRLRMMRTEDVEVLVEYRNHPDVARNQDWELPYTTEMAERLIDDQSVVDGPTDGQWVQMAVERGQEVIGDVAVGIHDSGRQGTIGYTIASHDARQRIHDGGRRGRSACTLRRGWPPPDRRLDRSSQPGVAPCPRESGLPLRGSITQLGVRPRRMDRRRPLRATRQRTHGPSHCRSSREAEIVG